MLAYKAAVPWMNKNNCWIPVYMYQNRHLNTAFQKEKKETTMNLRKKLLDKKKMIIKFGEKKLNCSFSYKCPR